MKNIRAFSCPGKKTVVYPLFANVATLMSALWLIPGTTIASLAPLERARVWSSAVLDAVSSPPLAATTILLDGPVSCIPRPELTNVLDAPESNMASVIASSVALASNRGVPESVWGSFKFGGQHIHHGQGSLLSREVRQMRCCIALVDLVCEFDPLHRHPKLQCSPGFLPHLDGGAVMGLPMGAQVSVSWARYGCFLLVSSFQEQI